MPYTRVTRTPNGADAIRYARGIDGKGHNSKDHRNEYVTGVNMLPDDAVPFEEQMQGIWNKARSNHTTQIDRYIISFSKEELNPDNPEDVLKGHEIACEIAGKIAPEHQAAVFTQIDGKSGLIHAHMLVSDVNIYNFKGLPSLRYKASYFEQFADKICEQHFEIKQTEPAAERDNQTARVKREKGQYVWQDDLKKRIKAAAEEATDEDDFAAKLLARGARIKPYTKNGVEKLKHNKTKKQPEHYTFELTDTSGFPADKQPGRALASKSYKLGDNYQPEKLAEQFRTNREAEMQAAEPEDEAPAQKPATLKKRKKPSAEQVKAQEEKTLPVAKAEAQQIAYQLYAAAKRQESNTAEQLKRQAAQCWKDYFAYRQKQKKQGTKPPPIYSRDDAGTVTVMRNNLETDYNTFLTLRNAEEEEKQRAKEAEARRLKEEKDRKAKAAIQRFLCEANSAEAVQKATTQKSLGPEFDMF